MSEVSAMLKEFHQKFGVEGDRTTPGVPNQGVAMLRFSLLREEFEEYVTALALEDVVEVADALADMVYIIYGTARSYGIPLDAVLAEVHRTNMAKLVNGKVLRRADGKVIKPEGWTPPNIAAVLAPYGYEPEPSS